MTEDKTYLDKVLEWRKEHISERQTKLVLAFVVGLLAALAAYILHSMIHIIQDLLRDEFGGMELNWYYLIFPSIGILLTMLFVRYVVRDNISHGITRILLAFSTKRGRLKAHNTWSSVVASALTIGFGGSVGAEAPIVLTGSAIGSNLAKIFRMDSKTIFLLVGCGSAAAIAGIFKAPIAGLVFTIEVLMVDLTMESLLPMLISSITATCFTYILVGDDALFTFTLQAPWDVERVPANIFLGIFCGLVSLYFIRSMTACENIFGKLKNHRYVKWILGGIVLSALIFFFPPLYGEGYTSINILLNGHGMDEWSTLMDQTMFTPNTLMLYLLCIILFKTVATASTNGAGGCGGTFAPSLFVGAFAGFFFGYLWNEYNVFGIHVPVENFALLGMAGLMSGVMHAPLTGVFLIAELTGGYHLFLPLFIVSIMSYLTIYLFEPHSIYGMRIAREGKLVTHHTDHAVLTLMSLDSVIEKDTSSVDPDMELSQLVHQLSRSQSDILPVVDNGKHLLGEIDITKLRHIVFRTELYHRFKVSQLMTPAPVVLGVNDSMEDVMKAFDESGATMLPVIDLNRCLVGYVSRSHLYTLYRKMVADMSAD